MYYYKKTQMVYKRLHDSIIGVDTYYIYHDGTHMCVTFDDAGNAFSADGRLEISNDPDRVVEIVVFEKEGLGSSKQELVLYVSERYGLYINLGNILPDKEIVLRTVNKYNSKLYGIKAYIEEDGSLSFSVDFLPEPPDENFDILVEGVLENIMQKIGRFFQMLEAEGVIEKII